MLSARAYGTGAKMKLRQSRRVKQTTLIFGSCIAIYCFLFVYRTPVYDPAAAAASISRLPNRTPLPPEVLGNLSLSEEQCDASFPGLTKEIDLAVAQGPFKVKQMGKTGHLQGRIENGQVRVHSDKT